MVKQIDSCLLSNFVSVCWLCLHLSDDVQMSLFLIGEEEIRRPQFLHEFRRHHQWICEVVTQPVVRPLLPENKRITLLSFSVVQVFCR